MSTTPAAAFNVVFAEEPTPAESRALADQLRRLRDVDEAAPLRLPAPDGAKAGDEITWALIGVETAKIVAPVVLVEVVAWLKAWRRRPNARLVKVEVPTADGGTIVIDPAGAAPEEVAVLVERAKAALGA
jgi:hypothetical protein